MKFTVKEQLNDTPRGILQKAGYSEHYDPKMKKTSYSLRLGSNRFPRFHCYVKEGASGITFDLHIDQKQASYEGSRMHSGEYDGPLVEEELGRIKRWVDASRNASDSSESSNKKQPDASGPKLPTSTPEVEEKRGFFKRLFDI